MASITSFTEGCAVTPTRCPFQIITQNSPGYLPWALTIYVYICPQDVVNLNPTVLVFTLQEFDHTSATIQHRNHSAQPNVLKWIDTPSLTGTRQLYEFTSACSICSIS